MDKKIQNRIFNFTSCNSGLHFTGNTINQIVSGMGVNLCYVIITVVG